VKVQRASVRLIVFRLLNDPIEWVIGFLGVNIDYSICIRRSIPKPKQFDAAEGEKNNNSAPLSNDSGVQFISMVFTSNC